jgi:hypothetical protein
VGRMTWATPELFVLGSGAESEANKIQTFSEGDPGRSCEPVDPGDVGIGCPGSLNGPS